MAKERSIYIAKQLKKAFLDDTCFYLLKDKAQLLYISFELISEHSNFMTAVICPIYAFGSNFNLKRLSVFLRFIRFRQIALPDIEQISVTSDRNVLNLAL
jgi:hypothetical protein